MDHARGRHGGGAPVLRRPAGGVALTAADSGRPAEEQATTTNPPPPSGDRRSRAGADLLLPVGSALLALVAYQAVAARHPVEWDGAQLVMGLDRFDVANGTPHPPGYWLYLAAGRLVRGVTPLDGTASLTLVSSLAAAAAVGLVAALGRAMGGRLVGVMAAGLVLTSPFVWFYAASVDTYTLDALACVVLLTLAWHARPGSAHGIAAAVALGLAAGFRQTSLLVFAPIAVIAMARSARSRRTWAAGGLAGAAAIGSWLVPMLLEQPGGLSAWRAASDEILAGSVEQTSILTGTAEVVTRNMVQGSTYAFVAFLPALVATTAALVALVAAGRSPGRTGTGAHRPGSDRGRPRWASAPVLAAAGSLPALAFLLLIHFGKAGYLLAVVPAGVLLLLLPARSLHGRSRVAVAVAVALVCALSAQRFLGGPGILPARVVDATPVFFTRSVNGAPFAFTREVIEASDHLTDQQLGLRERFDPATDVLVWGWLNGGERFRHGTLTLPEFRTAFVRDSVHLHTARDLRWTTDPDRQVEVPAEGRAVFVLDHVPPDLQALLDQGLATGVRLRTGLTVWVVEPGVTLLGVDVVEGTPAIDLP